MEHFKRMFGILLAVFILCGTCVSAFAMTAGDVDFDRTGSIFIEMQSDSGQIITSGELTLYKVATLEKTAVGDSEYTVTEAFSGCNVESMSEEETAAVLAEWAAEHEVTGIQQSVSANGTVTFEDLELGVYLIVQTTESDGYVAMNPFIATVPLELDGMVVYDIDATPKMSAIAANPTVSNPVVSEPTVSTEPIVTSEPVVSNTTDGTDKTNGAKTGDTIMISAISLAVIACAVGGITAVNKRKGSAE